MISTAPPARYRAADPGPNRGRNAPGGRAVYSVVPVPEASATNASGHCAAARSPRSSSAGRSAGRSAASPAVPEPGHRAAATAAPCASAGLSPAAGSSGSTCAPSAPSAPAAAASSVTTITAATAGQATAALTVSAAMASASADLAGPARSARRDLARASTLTGITSDQASGLSVTPATILCPSPARCSRRGRAGLARRWSCLDTTPGETGDLPAMTSALTTRRRPHR